jgi:hypothetical protein
MRISAWADVVTIWASCTEAVAALPPGGAKDGFGGKSEVFAAVEFGGFAAALDEESVAAVATVGSGAATRGIGTETEGCTGPIAAALTEESRCCASGELVAALVDGVSLAAAAFGALGALGEAAPGLFVAGSGLALFVGFVPASAKGLFAADEGPDVPELCGKLAA